MHRSQRLATKRSAFTLSFAFLAGCGQSDATVAHLADSSTSYGGVSGHGGVPSTGGTTNTGGAANGTGGAANLGGAANTGGVPSTGGTTNTGGVSTGGTSNGTGGANSTGGSVGTGGGGQTSSAPSVGAHVMTYYSIGDGTAPLVTPPMMVQVSGSTIIVGLGRGNKALFSTAPTDNKTNAAYTSLGVHPYPLSTDSGTAAYAFLSATGGTGFKVSAQNGLSLGGNTDEMTLFVIEITNGSRVVDSAWMDTSAVNPTASISVTTTAAATLVAFWWGDSTSVNSIVSNDAFTVLDKQLLATDQVQGASAFKNVTSGGTYSVTWTASPAQPAQLWLVAVQ